MGTGMEPLGAAAASGAASDFVRQGLIGPPQ